ncbi:MAG: acetate kinase, partial [Dokdonella sp.]
LAAWMSANNAEPDIVVHRIVHGGTLEGPCRLDSESIATLSRFAAWAPDHQTPALALVDAAIERWPSASQVALFDTDWHRTLPHLTRTFALSKALRSEGLHRYGFHGIAYQSVWRQFRELQSDAMNRRVVCAHLGGGSSLCAVQGGHSIDTTMGLTPMDGLPMATRCGSLDPGVVLHLLGGEKFSVSTLDFELNQNSGLLGLSGTTGDMQRLLATDTSEARLAVAIFVHRAAQGIVSMATTLGGIDDLVFSGGIGTHSSQIRSAIVDKLRWIGLTLDREANNAQRQNVGAETSAAQILVLDAYEDRELAAASLAVA